MCVLNTFWCISVSLWKFWPWWDGSWFEHGCFWLWQCVKIDHAGECWESGSYKQEKVTEALQVALWQAWWDDLGDFWFFAAPNSWMNYWACSARHVTKRPGGISLPLSYCAGMDMHQQVNRCGSAHVYYLPQDLNLGQATRLLLKTKQMQKRWKGLNSKCLLCHTVTRWLHWKGDPFQMHQTLSVQLYVRHVQVLKLNLMWRFAGVKFLGKLTTTRWCLFNTFEGSWSASSHHFVSRLSPHLEWAAQRIEWPPLYPLLWPLIVVPLPVSE
jgi:hypothetical protein